MEDFKFKIGDKVKVISLMKTDYNDILNGTFVITEVYKDGVVVKNNDGYHIYLINSQIELVKDIEMIEISLNEYLDLIHCKNILDSLKNYINND